MAAKICYFFKKLKEKSMANRFLIAAMAASAILALSGCACSDISDWCPTNVWTKPV